MPAINPSVPASSDWSERALRRTVVGALVGLFVSVVVLFWSWLWPNNPIAARGLDIVMRVYAGGPPQRLDVPRYVFIDADDATCADLRGQDWSACDSDGALLRERYANAIETANLDGAKLIILDFDLSRPAQTGDKDNAADKKIREALLNGHTPVVVARPLRHTIGKTASQIRYYWASTIIDDMQSPRLRFGHVTWLPDDDAGTIRRQSPCFPAWQKDTTTVQMAIIPLTYCAALRQDRRHVEDS